MIPYKLSPIEKSVLYSLDRPLKTEEIPKKINYVRQDNLKEWLEPILERLMATGYIKKVGQRWKIG